MFVPDDESYWNVDTPAVKSSAARRAVAVGAIEPFPHRPALIHFLDVLDLNVSCRVGYEILAAVQNLQMHLGAPALCAAPR